MISISKSGSGSCLIVLMLGLMLEKHATCPKKLALENQ